MKNTKLNTYLLVTFILIGFNTCFAAPPPIFTAGIGQGTATVRGDYVVDLSHTVVALGIDYESDKLLFTFDGHVSQNDTFKQLRLLAGYGNRYIKLGTGLIGLQSSIPTAPGALWFFPFDTNRRTDVSATTVPLYLRLHPYVSEDIQVTIDGYYGLYTQGSLSIPMKLGGKVSTEPKRSHGRYGYGASIQWRSSRWPRIGLKLGYSVDVGEMDAGSSVVSGDPFGLIPPLSMPALTLENRTVLLSVVIFGKE